MLKLKVAIPAPGMDFDFNEARPLPFLSAPSTPKRFGDYTLSAPTSPSRAADFYSYFDSLIDSNEEGTGVPFHWEDRPGTPKSPRANFNTNGEDDFAFDFSAELENKSLSADELFDEGKIRSLKLPPRLQVDDSTQRSPLSSPRSPIHKGKKMIREAFSPRKKKDSDPFATAVENTRKRTDKNERGRERERGSGLTSSSSRRASRSLTLFRASEYPWEEEKQLDKITNQSAENPKALVSSNSSSSSSSSSNSSSKSSSRKWRLRDFLLFRSASEGHAHEKDRLRKYSGLFKKHEDGKEPSFLSTDSSGSASLRRKGPVSAHELHYTVNKAASENLKKKTFLPYKQGFFGRLAFNRAPHAPGNGFATSTR